MSINELTVESYTFFALARATDNDQLVQAAKAFLQAAPGARPDLSNASRSDLSVNGFALHQKTIPLNVQALSELQKIHFDGVEAEAIEDRALKAFANSLGTDLFYGSQSTATTNTYGLEEDAHIFQAVADLAVGDGFDRQVEMARNFFSGAKGVTVTRPYDKDCLKLPASECPEVSAALNYLKAEHLTELHGDLDANPLIAIENAAIKAAKQQLVAGARVAARTMG